MLRFNSVLAFACLGLVTLAHAGESFDIDSYSPLTSDQRARYVGESLVILVAESTIAESSAATGIERDTRIRARANDNENELSAGFGLSAEDAGAGQTIRRGRAVTQISVVIVEKLPHRMLRIEGKKMLKINGEDQLISLSGKIREIDIQTDNSLLSSRISDANIEIHGNGSISDAQRETVIYKVLKWLRLV